MKYGQKAIKKAKLEIWDNPNPEKRYEIEINFPEFTCLCPRSGYPDFATIKVKYVPDKYVIELKSLKLYFNKFRNQYISHEAATNKIYDHIKKTIKPRYIEVTGDFTPRGNVKTVIFISSDKEKNSLP